MRITKYLLARLTLSCLFATLALSGYAQVKGTKYTFKDIKRLDASPIRDQYHSGTCWDFSTSSFLESELLRMGKGEVQLSEMFFVRMDYEEKAFWYVKMHGGMSWGQGGEFHDVLRIYKEYGAMPYDAYPVLSELPGKPKLNELEAVLKGMLDAVIKNPNGELSPYWKDAVRGVLDAYLGKVPEKFPYKGKEYTARTFAEMLGINPDDYVEITSVTDEPVNGQFVNYVTDNWHSDLIYNVSLNDMKDVLNNSIDKGYTVAWGADVSEPGFAYKKGVAVLPDLEWDTIAKDKRDTFIDNPMKQMTVTPAWRQHEIDNFNTTDDHGMQITGTAEDQLGDKFFIVKNSWGTKLSNFKGYFYASESYVLAKTTAIMVNKKAIPRGIAKKLGV